MEAEAAVQLNLDFESSRENIGQAKFTSNRESNQNSFLGRRFGGSRGLFARNLLHRPDQLWKVILALTVLIFVLFASIAMLVHFASAAAKVSPPPHDSDPHHHNHHHTTAQHLKLENKSEVVSPSPPPPPTPSLAPVIQEQSKTAADVINSNSTSSTSTTPPPPLIVSHNETTINASTNATVVQQQPSIPWTPDCGTWAPYRDESCFHLLTGELWTWEEAAERCRGLGVGVTMLSIRDAPKQQFFREYIFGQQHKASFEDVWLGARYRNASGDFRWADDGQAVVYGDWAPEHHFSASTSLTTAEKHGNNGRQGRSLLWFEQQQQHSHSHEVDALYDVIEGKATLVGEEHVPAQPSSSWSPPPPLPPLPSHLITPKQQKQYTDQDCLHLTAFEGRWEATPCAKRNLVLCEVLPLWSFAQFQRHFLDFRKEAEQKVAAVIPVGFVYSQFDGQQPPPSALWPAMTWAELPGKTVQDARGNLVETIRFWKRIA